MTRYNRRLHPDLELRVTIDGQVIIGPIQAMLQEAMELVEMLNCTLGAPVVETAAGGSGGGGAILTRTGKAVVERYRV
jgi:hypothetical protein